MTQQKRKSYVIRVVLLLLSIFVIWWIVGAGQCKAYFTESGVPMAGQRVFFAELSVLVTVQKSRVDSFDVNSNEFERLDDKGCLNLGWRLFNRPKQVLVWFIEPDGRAKGLSFEGSYFNCATIDLTPPTTTVTWRPRMGPSRWPERVTITESGATTTVTKTKRILFYSSTSTSTTWTGLPFPTNGIPVATPNAPAEE